MKTLVRTHIHNSWNDARITITAVNTILSILILSLSQWNKSRNNATITIQENGVEPQCLSRDHAEIATIPWNISSVKPHLFHFLQSFTTFSANTKMHWKPRCYNPIMVYVFIKCGVLGDCEKTMEKCGFCHFHIVFTVQQQYHEFEASLNTGSWQHK